uniref:DUF4283 domain-containing protein n=1 Tax=Panagrellus redivivus TaxID=6233 RepID=A0A7E4US71_PANRE
MKFTEPVNFSTVWPLLKNCKQFELNITNLVYDKNMATTMPLHRPMIASWVAFRNLPVSVYVVMPIINYFSTNPNFPQCVVLTFLPGTTFSDLQPLIKTAQEKMHDSGVMFNKSGEHVSINNGQQPPENDNAEIKDVVLRVTPEGWYQVDYYLPL